MGIDAGKGDDGAQAVVKEKEGDEKFKKFLVC